MCTAHTPPGDEAWTRRVSSRRPASAVRPESPRDPGNGRLSPQNPRAGRGSGTWGRHVRTGGRGQGAGTAGGLARGLHETPCGPRARTRGRSHAWGGTEAEVGAGRPTRAVGTRGLHAGPRAEGPGTATHVIAGLGAASLDPGRTLAGQRSPGPWTGQALPRPVPCVCVGPLGVISRVAFHTWGQQHGDDPVHKADAHPSRLHRCARQVCPLKAAPRRQRGPSPPPVPV